MNANKKLSISTCYSNAWNAFSKWWIPLCLLATALLFGEITSKHLAKIQAAPFVQPLSELLVAIGNNQPDQIENQLTILSEESLIYSRKLLKIALYAVPFAGILSVLLIATSLMAAKNKKEKLSIKQVLFTALVQLGLAIIKVLLLFFIFPLGLFIYIKLYFTILLMFEKKLSPAKAIKTSWAMTRGNFGSLLLLSFLNTLIQGLLGITVIGFIPATGFINTVRATAFQSLENNES